MLFSWRSGVALRVPVGTSRRIRPRVPSTCISAGRARVYELLRKVHGARFAREVQNNSLPRDLRPRSASRSLWTTLMIPCAEILLPASLPHPCSGVLRLEAKMKGAWEDWNRDDDVESSDEGNIICCEKKITNDRIEKLDHRNIDSLWWMLRIIIRLN